MFTQGLAGQPMSQAANPPRFEGELTKIGYRSGKWQLRYFELHPQRLDYAARKGGATKGSVPLVAATVEAVACGEAFAQDALAPGVLPKQPVPPSAFKVTSVYQGRQRSYYMFAATDQLRDHWIAAIRDAAATAPSAPSGAMPASNMMGFPGAKPGGLGKRGGGAGLGGFGGLTGMMAAMTGGGGGAAASQETQFFPMPSAPPANRCQQEPSHKPAPPMGASAPLSPLPVPAMETAGTGAGGAPVNMGAMFKQATGAMATLQAHQQDPHLSAQDNGLALASKIQDTTGISGYTNALKDALKKLDAQHLPEGLAGFLVTEPPQPGTLSSDAGLQLYDFIFEIEGTGIKPEMTQQQFSEARKTAFATQGTFTLGVYNMQFKSYRCAKVVMPPGKPNAILGLSASKLPYSEPKPDNRIFVKGSRKVGGAFVSHGSYFPIDAPNSASDMDVYVKVWRSGGGGMMVSSNDHHPLYAYTQLSEPLFVKAWRTVNGMMVNGTEMGSYAPLPMAR